MVSKRFFAIRPYLRYLSSLSPLRITENNNAVSKAIETFVSERKDDALASYIKIKDSKLMTDMSNQPDLKKVKRLASFTSHPIDFPAPAPIAHAIQQHAKVLSLT